MSHGSAKYTIKNWMLEQYRMSTVLHNKIFYTIFSTEESTVLLVKSLLFLPYRLRLYGWESKTNSVAVSDFLRMRDQAICAFNCHLRLVHTTYSLTRSTRIFWLFMFRDLLFSSSPSTALQLISRPNSSPDDPSPLHQSHYFCCYLSLQLFC